MDSVGVATSPIYTSAVDIIRNSIVSAVIQCFTTAFTYPVIIACAFKEVAILFSYDAGVQTTLGDYHVLDAPFSVLLERIVTTL